MYPKGTSNSQYNQTRQVLSHLKNNSEYCQEHPEHRGSWDPKRTQDSRKKGDTNAQASRGGDWRCCQTEFDWLPTQALKRTLAPESNQLQWVWTQCKLTVISLFISSAREYVNVSSSLDFQYLSICSLTVLPMKRLLGSNTGFTAFTCRSARESSRSLLVQFIWPGTWSSTRRETIGHAVG